MGRSLFEKLWDEHRVEGLEDGNDLIYIDRILLHERTGSIALSALEDAGRAVLWPEQVYCCMDHIVDTFPDRTDDTLVPSGRDFIVATRSLTQSAGIRLFDLDDPEQGIVHVVSPELGIVQPGATLVCPDSHTCTQGAVGALAWGIGSSEAEHALATRTLRVRRPGSMRVIFDGIPPEGVTAKDMILRLIAEHGAAGGSGHVIEFAGEAVESLAMEGRMTLCNMAVEFSAFTGLVAPDAKTLAYLADRPLGPEPELRGAAEAWWLTLRSDDDARFDREIRIDTTGLAPQVSWGTSPQHSVAIDDPVPAVPTEEGVARSSMLRALSYMGLEPGDCLAGQRVTGAFIGSCTNSRIDDLRAAARVLSGRRVAAGLRAICVPGSMKVKAQAEAEGLHRVFEEAGFEWRAAGCSMCFYAGGEHMGEGERVISTTNRNFEGRQGPKTRTHIASPATVAASAIAGCIADPRAYL